MELPPGLQKIFEEKTLRLKKEFHELNCCENKISDFEKLRECLTRAKILINHYQDVYFKFIEQSKSYSMLEELKFKKQDYIKECFDFNEIPDDANITKLQECLKNACEYITKFEGLLGELGFPDFK